MLTDTREQFENRNVIGTGSLCSPAPTECAARRKGDMRNSYGAGEAARRKTKKQTSAENDRTHAERDGGGCCSIRKNNVLPIEQIGGREHAPA